MILFFDRTVGKEIPIALKDHLKPPDLQIEYHQEHFPHDMPDDDWLPLVGKWGWTVIGQDYSYHLKSPEVQAIIDFKVGAFYLWGSEAPRWETMRAFARGYDNILKRAAVTPTPFVFRIEKHGGATELYVMP